MLDARSAIRDFREVVSAELFLLFEAERTMIGGDDLQVIELQSAPQFFLVVLFADRRRHHPLRPFESFLLVYAVIEEEILRTRRRRHRQSRVARTRPFLPRLVATERNG